MKKRSIYHDINFQAVIALLVVTLALIITAYLGFYPMDVTAGPLPAHHWAGIAGFTLIVLFNPAYSILKRRRPKTFKTLFKLHPYINLAGFLLISVHMAHQASEGINSVVDTGTGFLQYFVVILLVATGVIRRFQLFAGQRKAWKFLHESLSVTLLVLVIGHILRVYKIL